MIPESWGGEPGRRTRQEVSGQQDQNKNQFSLLVSACCSGLMLLLSLLVTVCLHFLGSGTFFFSAFLSLFTLAHMVRVIVMVIIIIIVSG